MTTVQLPLIQLFGDVNYAWQLLECQVKLETLQNVTGEDISHLLQLYMRGVQKMNSLLDIRQSFFKNRVTTLMSRPTVIKSLNKPMSKKNVAPVVQSSPVKKIEVRNQLQLQQKKKQIEMRLAYGVQENNPDALKKMMHEHTQKQTILSKKINKIVDQHEQRLMKRVRQRKLRTVTAKSRSQMFMNNDTNDTSAQQFYSKKQLMEQRRDQQQFGKNNNLNNLIKPQQKKQKQIRRFKSLQPKKTKFGFDGDSPIKRRVSVDLTLQKKKQT